MDFLIKSAVDYWRGQLFFAFLRSCSICERVTPRLSHANSAVVLSAVKVLMKFLELLPKDSDYYNTLLKKLSPPLVTLLSGEPEVQYVALRNINLIVQKRCVFTHIPSVPAAFQPYLCLSDLCIFVSDAGTMPQIQS